MEKKLYIIYKLKPHYFQNVTIYYTFYAYLRVVRVTIWLVPSDNYPTLCVHSYLRFLILDHWFIIFSLCLATCYVTHMSPYQHEGYGEWISFKESNCMWELPSRELLHQYLTLHPRESSMRNDFFCKGTINLSTRNLVIQLKFIWRLAISWRAVEALWRDAKT